MNTPAAPKPRSVEIEDLARFDELVAAGASAMAGWHLQSLDLRGRDASLRELAAEGSVFLGCDFDPGLEEDLRSRGALIFPHLPGIPFNAYRGHLYTGAELYAGVEGSTYEQTPDARIYQWSLQSPTGRSLDATLATAMHDHAIGDALDAALKYGDLSGRRMVGVMGGHALPRGSREYANAAHLGQLLARRGFLVATGGGPGAMEAANLGAYLAAHDDGAVAGALAELAAVPGFRPSISAWARAATAVVDRYPNGTASLGIPTWFYGHEPPNVFATHIAKYFANSIREAVLLARCDGGIIFLPGAAGTVQEIFQDACENYYAAPEAVAPIILVGLRHWQQDLPVWDLLQRLAAGRAMAEHIHCVETVEEAVEVLAGGRVANG
ncbi:LOG family protein [Paenarthrobacter sp. Z7-10]|uniref:LOG family protein n=1 Tax=Paenarthrobacter sp. Z7-10 TaxID=2787635 RepID=UPI0022A9D792|nr:LOG family protein [Paenarthrobacter sp. Z7-10]MCZ2404049.1 LOG family protein [Paenarthrobacter sp. Z7-10]